MQFSKHILAETALREYEWDSSPHADENVSITENEEQNILLGDVMKVGALLVGEEQVRFPETFEHLGIDSERVGLEVLR